MSGPPSLTQSNVTHGSVFHCSHRPASSPCGSCRCSSERSGFISTLFVSFITIVQPRAVCELQSAVTLNQNLPGLIRSTVNVFLQCRALPLCLRADVPGDVGVVSDAGVTEHVGGPLGHQDLDLVYGAAELQEAQVEAWGEPVSAAPLVRQNILEDGHRDG